MQSPIDQPSEAVRRLTASDIDDIAAVASRSSQPILALYLDRLDTGMPVPPDAMIAAVRRSLASASGPPTGVGTALAPLEAALGRGAELLRSLVYTVSLDGGWSVVRTTQLPVRTSVRCQSPAFIRPLLALRESTKAYGIVLVSEGMVRLVTWRGGLLVDDEVIEIEIAGAAGRERQGPARASHRRVSAHRDRIEHGRRARWVRHLSEVAAVVNRNLEGSWAGVLTAGADHRRAELERALGTAHQDSIIARVTGDLVNHTPADIGMTAEREIRHWRDVRDAAAAEAWRATLAQGSLDEPRAIFAALDAGRVGRLLVDPDAHGTANVELPNEEQSVDLAVALALRRGTELWVLSEKGAEILRSRGCHLGAVLRY